MCALAIAMVSRDWLVAVAPSVAAYVQGLCQRRYQEMEAQVVGLYALAGEGGTERFLAPAEHALEREAVGGESPRAPPSALSPAAADSPRAPPPAPARSHFRPLATFPPLQGSGVSAAVPAGYGLGLANLVRRHGRGHEPDRPAGRRHHHRGLSDAQGGSVSGRGAARCL